MQSIPYHAHLGLVLLECDIAQLNIILGKVFSYHACDRNTYHLLGLSPFWLAAITMGRGCDICYGRWQSKLKNFPLLWG